MADIAKLKAEIDGDHVRATVLGKIKESEL